MMPVPVSNSGHLVTTILYCIKRSSSVDCVIRQVTQIACQNSTSWTLVITPQLWSIIQSAWSINHLPWSDKVVYSSCAGCSCGRWYLDGDITNAIYEFWIFGLLLLVYPCRVEYLYSTEVGYWCFAKRDMWLHAMAKYQLGYCALIPSSKSNISVEGGNTALWPYNILLTCTDIALTAISLFMVESHKKALW